MAQESVVLLENADRVLPLKPSTVKPLKVAVLGLMANASGVDGAPGGGMLGEYYSPFNTVANNHTTVMALQRRAGLAVSFAPGFAYCPNGWFCDDSALMAEAIHLADSSEIVVAVVGLQYPIEAEDHDRVSMRLPGPQLAMLKGAHKTGVPLIVVLVSGGALGGDDMQWVQDNAAAVVHASYGGEMAGEGIASILLGEVNPSAKLPLTIYPESFEERPRYLMDMRGRGGITHRFYTGKPIWPFGHGAFHRIHCSTTFTVVLNYLSV